MIDEAQLKELRLGFPGAERMSEAGKEYVFLPCLNISCAGTMHTVEGLLSLCEASPYPTRLFLSTQITEAGLNWNGSVRVMDRTWHTWSWKDVSSSSRLVQILAAHLRAFK